jgi:hypothetical protein
LKVLTFRRDAVVAPIAGRHQRPPVAAINAKRRVAITVVRPELRPRSAPTGFGCHGWE